jgi:photosystem II stability/assembly factor-like uncharacterized protein/sugar lactone lactonase YvrE
MVPFAAILGMCGTDVRGGELSYDFKDVTFVTSDAGWLNTGPSILRTLDGGRTWTVQSPPQEDPARTRWVDQMQFLDPRHGWVLLDGGSFYQTSDGGENWERIETQPGKTSPSFGKPGLAAFAMISPQVGFALTAEESLLLRTTDGWRTWETHRIRRWRASLDKLTFLDANRGWAAGRESIYTTNDGGRTWRYLAKAPGHTLQFLSETDWWALEYDTRRLVRTRDGGQTWQICGVTDPPIRIDAFAFRTPDMGWAAGQAGFMLRTTDGCMTWETVHTSAIANFNAVHFVDARIGWVVGEADTVVKTVDGGQTWELIEVPMTPAVAEFTKILGKNIFSGEDLGDGGPAVNARLGYPSGLAIEANGTLFIADTVNNRIRRVSPQTGMITTVAGRGPTGIEKAAFSGDGGPATSARLDAPTGVVLDSDGNLVIAHAFTSRIRRVASRTGTITTIAGMGVPGFSGDGGPAVRAQLNQPSALAVDARGSLFICDTQNHRIRKVDMSTGIVTTVAGTGVAGFSGDGGPAVKAQLNYPGGLAVDARGNLFVSDTWNHRVRRIDASTGIVTTVAGTGVAGFSGDGGPAVKAQFNYPLGLAIDTSGNLFVAESAGQRVRKITAGGAIATTVAGTGVYGFSGDGGPATPAQLRSPTAVVVDASGNLFIADQVNNRIRKVTAGTGIITTIAGGAQ